MIRESDNEKESTPKNKELIQSCLLVGSLIVFLLLGADLTNYYAKIPILWSLTFTTPILYVIFWNILVILLLSNGKVSIDENNTKFKFLFFYATFLVILVCFIYVLTGFIAGIIYYIFLILDYLNKNINLVPLNIYTFYLKYERIIIGPLREELGKILPIFLIGYYLDTDKTDKISLIQKLKKKLDLEVIDLSSELQCIYYGLIAGLLFDFIETYLYVIQTSTNFGRFYELLLRLTTPVHLLTTIIISIGVYKFLKSYHENDNKTNRMKFNVFVSKFIPYFLLGWSIHIVWNSLPTLISYVVINYIPSLLFTLQNILLYLLIGIGLTLNVIIILILLKVDKRKLILSFKR